MTLKARITAIDRFVKGLKEDGIYTDLQAACVMAGWDSLAGALTPLKGAAPTNSGFLATDYDRGVGIQGDNTNKYINSNRAGNADGQNDCHVAAYVSASSNLATHRVFGNSNSGSTAGIVSVGRQSGFGVFARLKTLAYHVHSEDPAAVGLIGVSRQDAGGYSFRCSSSTEAVDEASDGNASGDTTLFKLGTADTVFTDNALSFYSIGSSLGSDPATGLAALDARVSTLMADLRAIEETGFDRDAIAYLRAVEEADGAFLETSVKVAINNLVSGLKAEGLWDAIGSSCLLCGPRTITGALVPLRGPAPTAQGGWSSGDYDRSSGLTGDGNALYLDSNVANNSDFGGTVADPQNDNHNAVYATAIAAANGVFIASGNADVSAPGTNLLAGGASANVFGRNRSAANTNTGSLPAAGFIAANRSVSGEYVVRNGESETTASVASQTPTGDNILLFRRGSGSFAYSAHTIAFYSIGSSLDLAALDSHISSYVTAIGAAI
jgi:hypothetical protein